MSIYLLCLLLMGCLSLPAQKKVSLPAQEKLWPWSKSKWSKTESEEYWDIFDCETNFNKLVGAHQTTDTKSFAEFCEDSMGRCQMEQISKIWGDSAGMTLDQLEIATLQADKKKSVIFRYCVFMQNSMKKGRPKDVSQKAGREAFEFPTTKEYKEALEKFTNIEERSFFFWGLGECFHNYTDLVKTGNSYFPDSSWLKKKKKYDVQFCHLGQNRCLINEFLTILGGNNKIDIQQLDNLMDQQRNHDGVIYKYCIVMHSYMEAFFKQCMDNPFKKYVDHKLVPARRRKLICREEVREEHYSKTKTTLEQQFQLPNRDDLRTMAGKKIS